MFVIFSRVTYTLIMFFQRLRHGGTDLSGLVQVGTVRELQTQELTDKERGMLGCFDLAVRQEFFERIHESPLGIRLAKEVGLRMKVYDKDPNKPVALSKIAHSATVDTVDILPMESSHSDLRSLTDPYIMDKNGVLCVEASMLAEVAEHLAYGWSGDRPDYTGYTQEVFLKTMGIDGKAGYHMVLKSVFSVEDGRQVSRFSDPINGLEDSWEALVDGEAYLDFEARPTDIVGFSEPIKFLWYPPRS